MGATVWINVGYGVIFCRARMRWAVGCTVLRAWGAVHRVLFTVCCVLCAVYGFTAVGRSLLRGSCGYFYVYRGLGGG